MLEIGPPVRVVLTAIVLSSFQLTEPCALPYWWLQKYQIPQTYLQGVQPKTTYVYREFLQVFNPNNFVHTKEYSEHTWWETGNSDSIPPNNSVDRASGFDNSGIRTTKTKSQSGITKKDGTTIGKGKVPPKIPVETTTHREFVTERKQTSGPPTTTEEEEEQVTSFVNPEIERNEDESEQIQNDDLNRSSTNGAKLDLVREDPEPSNGLGKDGGLFSSWFDWGYEESNETRPCDPKEADIQSLRSMIEKMFNLPREHTSHEENKEKARQDILNKFKEFGLQVWTQNFTVPEQPNEVGQEESKEGVNLIGVIPGLQRGRYEDGIVLVGAHYDTVPDSNGVDDNGSGLAVMLEIAKMLTQPRCKFNNTLMFVAFDLQENGAMGSNYFVDNYLIPEELKRARAHFQGAFILDGIMNFNDKPDSQELPVDYAESLPALRYFVNNTGNRGDFLAMISRNHVDNNLSVKLMEAWQKLGEHNYKLYNLAINMGSRIPPPSAIESHLNFLSSDHATFWYHNSTSNFPETLNAVLLTDTGPFRGQMQKCYHSECDNLSTMSPENLQFARKTANALSATLVEMTEATSAGSKLHLRILSISFALLAVVYSAKSSPTFM